MGRAPQFKHHFGHEIHGSAGSPAVLHHAIGYKTVLQIEALDQMATLQGLLYWDWNCNIESTICKEALGSRTSASITERTDGRVLLG